MISNERLKQIISEFKRIKLIHNQKDFAKMIGDNTSSLSEMITGVRPISEKFIHKIFKAFPQVSENWILTGMGELYNTNQITNPRSIVSEQAAPYSCRNCEFLRGQIYQLSEQNLKYEERIVNLCIEISELRRSQAEREASTG